LSGLAESPGGGRCVIKQTINTRISIIQRGPSFRGFTRTLDGSGSSFSMAGKIKKYEAPVELTIPRVLVRNSRKSGTGKRYAVISGPPTLSFAILKGEAGLIWEKRELRATSDRGGSASEGQYQLCRGRESEKRKPTQARKKGYATWGGAALRGEHRGPKTPRRQSL